MQKRIPYTISNFKTLITENYYYVDKTKYIEELERVKVPIFLRPRRFGKSLFTEMLRYYYDFKYANEFQELFENLYIGKNPTPKHNTYYYLKLNFSGMSAWGESEKDFIKKQFDSSIMVKLTGFLSYYKDDLKLNDEHLREFDNKYTNNAAGGLDKITELVYNQNSKIFLAIDEYDALTNAMAVYYQDAPPAENEYLNILKKGGFFRSFFEAIKAGTSTSIDQVYITGIQPITIADMNSGFNIATWLTFNRRFTNMLGFTEAEIVNLINEIYNDYEITIPKARILEVMKQYYDGYKFLSKSECLYNPMMTLYFLNYLIDTNELPDIMTDTNIRIDYNQISYIFGNNTTRRDEIILDITENKKMKFSSKLNINFDLNDYKEGNYIAEGLYYAGILTYGKNKYELKIPNLITYEMVLNYFNKIQNFRADGYQISKIVTKYGELGDVENLIEMFFTKVIQDYPGDFFINVNESFYHGLLFHILWNTFTKDTYEVLPEFNVPNGTVDIILYSYPDAEVRHPINDIFEIKRVKKSATEKEFESKFTEGKTQIRKYLTGKYKDWRGVVVCFRGNKDYKIKIINK